MAIRDPDRAEPRAPRYGIRLTGNPCDRLTAARSRVLLAAQGGFALPKGELARQAGVSTGVIDALVDLEVLEAVALPPEPVAPAPDPAHRVAELSASQAEAADRLSAAVGQGRFGVSLLEGITGSGKTEVYFEAVAEALRAGKQSLILMPEIALTAQFLARFETRFGVRPAEWHSGVASNRKNRLWKAIADGEAKVVVGARSALFLPFSRLGLVIVDEEHEQAYKQEDGVHYHARDMAVVRARLENCPVILASATPSVESRVNAESGRYAHVRLPERFGGRQLPKLSAIDLRAHPMRPGSWISAPLKQAVAETLEKGDQALLFLNRRGYAPLTLCRQCGHRWQCPQLQRLAGGASLPPQPALPSLRPYRTDAAALRGLRRGEQPDDLRTRRRAARGGGGRDLSGRPQHRALVRLPRGTERLRRELDAVANGEFQLVIGTQLVAKGHNFPGLALVGVVDADVGLSSGDPRAAERTFQLLQQVTGRAGRGDVAGRGFVQTHDPQHPVIRAILSGDAERFYAEEIAMRRAAGLPPFGRLAGLVVSGPDKLEAENHARALARAGLGLLHDDDCRNAGTACRCSAPAEAPIALIRGKHRFRLLARGPRDQDLQGFIRSMLANGPKERGGIRVGVDIDPMSFV